jgi:hypothetical protein
VRDEVFQVSELVEPYRVAPSIDLEEKSNFRVFDDNLVDVDAEELNVVLSFNGQANVDEDDDDIHIEDCDGADDYSNVDEEDDDIHIEHCDGADDYSIDDEEEKFFD